MKEKYGSEMGERRRGRKRAHILYSAARVMLMILVKRRGELVEKNGRTEKLDVSEIKRGLRGGNKQKGFTTGTYHLAQTAAARPILAPASLYFNSLSSCFYLSAINRLHLPKGRIGAPKNLLFSCLLSASASAQTETEGIRIQN